MGPIETVFSNDSYDTPVDTPRAFLDRLFFNSRIGFHLLFLKTVIRSRNLAIKGLYDNQAWAANSYEIFKDVERCGGRFHITGLDNIRKYPGPMVIVSNHMSTLETVILPGIISLYKEMTFVIKKKLVEIPVFKHIMIARNPITVARKNPREDLLMVLQEGEKILRKGLSLVIFPQSTRMREFIPGEFNSLGIKLASRAGVKILPVAIQTDFWENGRWLKDLGPIHRDRPIYLKFGEPMEIKGKGKEEHQAILDFISSNTEQWRKKTN